MQTEEKEKNNPSAFPISVRYLTFYFDNFTQNAFRYLSGTVALYIISVRFRYDVKKVLKSPRDMGNILVISVLAAAAQYCNVEGAARTPAVMGNIVLTLAFPLNIVLAAVLFQDEREIAKSFYFFLGTLFAVAGTAGIALNGKSGELNLEGGTLFFISGTVLYCIYSLFLKKAVTAVHSGTVALFTAGTECLLFFILSLLFGNPGKFFKSGGTVQLILLFSGAYGLIIGMGLAFLIVKHLGLIMMNFIILLSPVMTGILGYFLLGDTLTERQMGFGGILIFGCFLVLMRIRIVNFPSFQRKT